MSRAPHSGDNIIPAQLAFLAIYNPSLGQSDETLHDQVVYYHSSKSSRTRRLRKSDQDSAHQLNEEQNERLRQIGLAQGMVEFARAFSNGENLDSVESEKSRTLLHEIEPGWWVLVSVDLTRLQSTPESGASSATSRKANTIIEYSSREVCPQALLLQQVLRAHSIFLLHHAKSLTELYMRLTRQKFCDALERFWSRFIRDWEVLLHGNPAVDIYNGLKLAAGGELGIGVGEEDWGSGEREVLEGFIERTDGLVDVMVSRFGGTPEDLGTMPTSYGRGTTNQYSEPIKPWLASRSSPRFSDGVIFSGVGAISRDSLRSVSAWMEWLYKYGESAYGVHDNPLSAKRKKRTKAAAGTTKPDTPKESSEASHLNTQLRRNLPYKSDNGIMSGDSPSIPLKVSGIPPPIVVAAEHSLQAASITVRDRKSKIQSQELRTTKGPTKQEDSMLGTESLVKYMTLGIYGSSWGIPSGRPSLSRQASSRSSHSAAEPRKYRGSDPSSVSQDQESKPTTSSMDESNFHVNQGFIQGSYIIGLHGDLDVEIMTDDEANAGDLGTEREANAEQEDWNSRLSIRTLYVERSKPTENDTLEENGDDSTKGSTIGSDRLRVVVYVRQPFIFTFLFELQTDLLSMTSFYRSIHHQLGPLQRPLLASTSPTKVFERLWEAADSKSTTATANIQPIYDLVYDPANLTVHTTIPSIPESGTFAAEGLGSTKDTWTRIEALNVHSQILNTYISTRRHISELERTCKTSRGWWVVWMRLPRGAVTQHTGADSFREAFLIRKASDNQSPASRTSSMFGRGSSDGNSWASGKLAEGIGIDTRRYIEGLLSLNR